MAHARNSDTCRRQEDGTAEPIRKEVSRRGESKGKRIKKEGKARKTEKAIEQRKTNIKEKKRLFNSMKLFFYSCGKMEEVEKVKIEQTTGK